MKPLLITSKDNRHVKELVHLRDKRDRDSSGKFLIEGYRELLRARDGGQPIERLFICRELFLGTNEEKLIQAILKSGAELYELTEVLFRKISYRDRPDGLIAIAPQSPKSLAELQKILPPNPLIVVAEAIEKPGNLGTILRSSDAAGAHGLIVVDPCTDIYNPNVVRASVGTLFTVPTIEAESVDALSWLKEQGIKILSATPSAKTLYTDVDMTGPIAIAVGTEQLGLTKTWMEECDIQVKIPMLGQADSLNVAMATTLILFEAVRQRHQHEK